MHKIGHLLDSYNTPKIHNINLMAEITKQKSNQQPKNDNR